VTKAEALTLGENPLLGHARATPQEEAEAEAAAVEATAKVVVEAVVEVAQAEAVVEAQHLISIAPLKAA